MMALLAAPARAESLIAARTIPAHTVIAAEDLAFADKPVPGAATDAALVIGLETRVSIYRGFPILPDRLAAPALVERNQTVPLVYQAGGLSILAQGRALDRGAAGDAVRAMNAGSRAQVTGVVQPDGSILVTP